MLPIANTVLLLTLSNVFMTLPAHLKEMAHKPLVVVALSVIQLKILQEAITLTVFMPFALLYLKEPLKLDYLWARMQARLSCRRGDHPRSRTT